MASLATRYVAEHFCDREIARTPSLPLARKVPSGRRLYVDFFVSTLKLGYGSEAMERVPEYWRPIGN